MLSSRIILRLITRVCFIRNMLTTTKIGSNDVRVAGSADIDLNTAVNAQIFKDWRDKMDKNEKLEVKSIYFQSMDMFGSRVGFIKFKANVYHTDLTIEERHMALKNEDRMECSVENNIATTENMLTNSMDKVPVPGIVFMRGGSVGILVLLKSDISNIWYSICTVQSRVPVASSNFIEIPAGMLDGEGNFAGVAAKELQEETQLTISEDELTDMTALAYGDQFPGVYASPGGSDEFLRLFLYRKEVSEETIQSLQGRCTGHLEENEVITLKVVPLDELWNVTSDAKTLTAILLYEKLSSLKLIKK